MKLILTNLNWNVRKNIFTFADRADGTLSLSPRRNLAQGLAVLVFMGIGSAIGFLMVGDRPDIAALVGAVLGMVTGTFLGGFVIMFLPPPKIRLTRAQIQRKYRRCRIKFWVTSAVAIFLFVSLPLVIGTFGRESTDVAWLLCLGWPLAIVSTWVYARGLAQRLKEWRCPQCNEPLPEFREACPHCGFPMVSTSNDR